MLDKISDEVKIGDISAQLSQDILETFKSVFETKNEFGDILEKYRAYLDRGISAKRARNEICAEARTEGLDERQVQIRNMLCLYEETLINVENQFIVNNLANLQLNPNPFSSQLINSNAEADFRNSSQFIELSLGRDYEIEPREIFDIYYKLRSFDKEKDKYETCLKFIPALTELIVNQKATPDIENDLKEVINSNYFGSDKIVKLALVRAFLKNSHNLTNLNQLQSLIEYVGEDYKPSEDWREKSEFLIAFDFLKNPNIEIDTDKFLKIMEASDLVFDDQDTYSIASLMIKTKIFKPNSQINIFDFVEKNYADSPNKEEDETNFLKIFIDYFNSDADIELQQWLAPIKESFKSFFLSNKFKEINYEKDSDFIYKCVDIIKKLEDLGLISQEQDCDFYNSINKKILQELEPPSREQSPGIIGDVNFVSPSSTKRSSSVNNKHSRDLIDVEGFELSGVVKKARVEDGVVKEKENNLGKRFGGIGGLG